MNDDWLQRTLADSPAPLRERLQTVVAELDPGADLAEALLETACRFLEGAREGLERRESASDLLVADGLLTLACEAAAYSSAEDLADRCRAMGPCGELGRVAERWAGRS